MSDPQGYQAERRPLASRNRRISQLLAHGLASRRISPNTISILGLIAGIAGGFCLASTSHLSWPSVGFVAAIVCMQARLLANMLDGMVAIELKTTSPTGELFNEIPDRISDVATFVGAGYALGSESVLGWLVAVLAVLVAYVRAEGKVAGAHQEYCGPMAKPHRIFTMTVVSIWAAIAPGPVVVTTSDWGPIAWGLLMISAGAIVTIIRRLAKIAAALPK